MTSLAYLQGGDAVINSRAEKARVFNEYVKANKEAGVETNPADLDNLRMSLAGGDPFAASMIPAGDALKEFTNRANEQARNSQMKTQTERWAMQDTKDKYTQQIFDDNYYRSPEDFPKIFNDAFGEQEGAKMYDQYKPILADKLNESVGKQYAKIKENPASQYLIEPEDVDRLFPTQAKNPSMRKILESVRQDNQRARNKGQFKDTMEVLKDTPDFVANSPEGQQWWAGMAANGLGYSDPSQIPNPAQFQAGQNLAFTQAQAAQQAKVAEMAAKDPTFLTAARSGNEDDIFAATSLLMASSGMAPPRDKNDPNYQIVKRNLNLVSRTNAVGAYEKQEADIKSAVIQANDAIRSGAKGRIEAAKDAAFVGKEFSNGKSGKDRKLNESIDAALSLIANDPSFFPSQANVSAATSFIKEEFMAGKADFNPESVYAKFMAEGDLETEAAYTDREVNKRVQGNGLLKPGTNFQAKLDDRRTQITGFVGEQLKAMSIAPANQAEYTDILTRRATIVQKLKAQVADIEQSINTANNDPAVRNAITGFDFQTSLRNIEMLQDSIQQLESFVPIKPPEMRQPVAPSQPRPQAQEDMSFDARRERLSDQRTTTVITPMSYESVTSVPQTNAPRSRMDSYLDAIADVESSGDPFARAQTSSAKGLFQFTKGTWDNLVGRYGEKFGITVQDIWNPAAQRVMAQILTMENGNQLMRQTGKEPTERDLYLAHFLGPARAATVINHQGSQLLAANLFPDAAKANRGIFYKDGVPVTIEELYKKMGNKVSRKNK